jgi:hypothetical protein
LLHVDLYHTDAIILNEEMFIMSRKHKPWELDIFSSLNPNTKEEYDESVDEDDDLLKLGQSLLLLNQRILKRV